jgi:hypothetical protein
MRNKNIKDTFESFSPSEEQKEKIYKSIINRPGSKDKKIGPHFRTKLAYSLLACFILITAAAILLTCPNNNGDVSLIEPDNTQYNQTGIPSDKRAVFKGFILTAYAANGETSFLSANYMKETERTVLTPDVKVLLAQYTPAMSSVPGIPFTVDIAGNDKDSRRIEAIDVSADSGDLIRWDRDTGIVLSEGQSAAVDAGETIYWSPICGGDTADIKVVTISVEAISGSAVIGRQAIYITQDEQGFYYASAGEPELV